MGFEIKKKVVVDPATYSPKYLLHKHLCRVEEARPYGEVHASDLMSDRGDFCAREHCLGLQHNAKRPDRKLWTAESVTFAYGRSVEDMVRDWYADIGKAYGEWRCRVCNQLHPFGLRPEQCTVCGTSAFAYQEVRTVSATSGVVSRPDLFIDFGKPKLTLLEIKSMDKEQFKGLAAPLAEHRWRTNLYMRQIEESNLPFKDMIDTQRAFVFYVTKGGYGFKDEQVLRWKLGDSEFSPFKEYEVLRDDDETEPLVTHATAVDTFKKTGELPHGICQTSMVKRARFCQMHKPCWE